MWIQNTLVSIIKFVKSIYNFQNEFMLKKTIF